jgi:hypothetical protein
VATSDGTDPLLARQRELRDRHDALAGLGGAELHDADRLDAVLRDTDELMKVLAERDAATARRLLPVIFVLLGLAVGPAALVAFGVWPPVTLAVSVLLLAAAVGLWLAGRKLAEHAS